MKSLPKSEVCLTFVTQKKSSKADKSEVSLGKPKETLPRVDKFDVTFGGAYVYRYREVLGSISFDRFSIFVTQSIDKENEELQEKMDRIQTHKMHGQSFLLNVGGYESAVDLDDLFKINETCVELIFKVRANEPYRAWYAAWLNNPMFDGLRSKQ